MVLLLRRLDALGDREQAERAGQLDDHPGDDVVGVAAQAVDELPSTFSMSIGKRRRWASDE